MLWGKSSFFVSGNSNADANPASIVGTPSTSIGKGDHTEARLDTKGHNNPKILASVEKGL